MTTTTRNGWQTLPDNIRKFRLGVFASDATQPLSLMRDVGPFAMMTKEDARLELVFPPRDRAGNQILNWNWVIQCDAVFLSHPGHEAHVNCIALATMMGIPTWIEFVDSALAVRATNPAFHGIGSFKNLKADIGSACEIATVITVVSETGKAAFEKWFPQVNPNKFLVLPESCLWPPINAPRRKAVSWRGLHSHMEDVLTVLPAWVEIAREFKGKGWEWVLLGTPPEDLVESLIGAAGEESVLVSPFWPTPFHAVQAWSNRAPFLHLVPLADNEFNLGKSHLAYLEATAVGAAAVAPSHLPSWQEPGVIHYKTGLVTPDGPQDFATVLHREMLRFDEGKFHPAVAEARAAVYPARELRSMNQMRWAILRKLIGADVKANLPKLAEPERVELN